MIQANLPLVVTIARDYANLGQPLLDLISERNIRLMKAADRFDAEKGWKLMDQAGNQARICQPGQDNPITGSGGRVNWAGCGASLE
jgi:hypothetical protein